jgi:response regulator NasT
LVVDDDRLVLATLTHGLAQAGYDVVDADNGDDAILLARQHRPDLALLDIRMEGKSGFDVAAYLREYLHVPFMFLSAFADDDTVQKVQALGAVAYLVKPLDIGQILPTVAAAMARARQRDEADAGAADKSIAAVRAPGPSGQATGGAEAAVAAVRAAPAPALDDQALAVGVLMHRFSLTRAAALGRLERMAADERRTVAEQARRLVEAVELLARG